VKYKETRYWHGNLTSIFTSSFYHQQQRKHSTITVSQITERLLLNASSMKMPQDLFTSRLSSPFYCSLNAWHHSSFAIRAHIGSYTTIFRKAEIFMKLTWYSDGLYTVNQRSQILRHIRYFISHLEHRLNIEFIT
jgi:hypothetical protein